MKLLITICAQTQESCAEVARVIQSEWIFLQHATWDTGDEFAGVHKMLREIFSLVFFRTEKNLSPIIGALSTMPVKKDGLGPLNLATSVKENYLISQWGSAGIIRAVTRGGAFSDANHLLDPRRGKHDGQKDRDDTNKTKIDGLVKYLKGTNRPLNL